MAGEKEYKDFESALARLEEITGRLESGDLSLEESITLYSEGVKVAGVCNKKLADAEGKIAKLSKLADQFRLETMVEENDE